MVKLLQSYNSVAYSSCCTLDQIIGGQESCLLIRCFCRLQNRNCTSAHRWDPAKRLYVAQLSLLCLANNAEMKD
jgi:hypothetical protein